MYCYKMLLDIATTIGTVGATIVALWLGLRDGVKKIDGTFIWDAATSFQPTLFIQNMSKRIVVIESIEVKYRHKIVCIIHAGEDYNLAKYAIVEANKTQNIPMGKYDLRFPKQDNSKKKYVLKITIRQRNGRSAVSKLKYSFDEIGGLIFGQHFH